MFLGGYEVPLPTITFSDSYTLTVGSKTLELTYRGDDQEPGNIYVYAPDQRVLLKIDIIFPGRVPFKKLALAEDTFGYVNAHDVMLSFDIDWLVSGHFGRLASREDVVVQQEYIQDIVSNAMTALQTVYFFAIAAETRFQNLALLLDTYLETVAETCADLPTPDWLDRLGGADIWTVDHCSTMINALRID